MSIYVAAGLVCLSAGVVFGQIGPDIISSSHVDVARYGTDPTGAITSYAIGAVTCNHGDLPALVMPSGNSLLRPLIGQNMYRLKTFAAAGGGSYTRFEQVGQSWAKRVGVPISATTISCGTCVPVGGGMMAPNCADTYGSGFNGSAGLLGPRSMCNPVLGTSSGGAGTSVGDSITRGRIQVPTADVVGQPAGTRFFVETVHLLPDDAQYVRPGQTVAVNAMNNASSQEIGINGGTGNPTLLGGGNQQIPAVLRWRAADPQVVVVTVDHDDAPNPRQSGAFIRSRFYVAARVTDLSQTGGAGWRYEYAVFNLNSDRACGYLRLPVPDSTVPSEESFRHPRSHSGEPYSNAPWAVDRGPNWMAVGTEPFVVNPNANAVRWGTTYSFGFTSTVAPMTASARLGLFRPGAGPAELVVPGLPVPQWQCPSDFNGDGTNVADADIEAFFSCLAGSCCATCWHLGPDFNSDGDPGTDADIESFFRMLSGQGC